MPQCSHIEISDCEPLVKIDQALDQLKTFLSAQSRTAKLWVQFMDYIRIIQDFIASERLKDWHGHIRARSQLLNVLAATGHIHYAKSARLYVQSMSELPEKYPWLYSKFLEGAHAVERTDHSFNGLWSDLVIEQTLMRSMKTRGGLTRGRGLTESVRNQWVFSLPTSIAIHDAMMARTDTKIV